MVWGPLQEKHFPMFARICLPVFCPTGLSSCLPIFSSVVVGKKSFHNRGPLKQSQYPEKENLQETGRITKGGVALGDRGAAGPKQACVFPLVNSGVWQYVLRVSL